MLRIIPLQFCFTLYIFSCKAQCRSLTKNRSHEVICKIQHPLVCLLMFLITCLNDFYWEDGWEKLTAVSASIPSLHMLILLLLENNARRLFFLSNNYIIQTFSNAYKSSSKVSIKVEPAGIFMSATWYNCCVWLAATYLFHKFSVKIKFIFGFLLQNS